MLVWRCRFFFITTFHRCFTTSTIRGLEVFDSAKAFRASVPLAQETKIGFLCFVAFFFQIFFWGEGWNKTEMQEIPANKNRNQIMKNGGRKLPNSRFSSKKNTSFSVELGQGEKEYIIHKKQLKECSFLMVSMILCSFLPPDVLGERWFKFEHIFQVG